ncbi:hypothetical protein J6590_031746, partial [Homalodisca vitripennis]
MTFLKVLDYLGKEETFAPHLKSHVCDSVSYYTLKKQRVNVLVPPENGRNSYMISIASMIEAN